MTPLQMAARAGHLEAVRILVRKFDANIDSVNKVKARMYLVAWGV